MLQFSRVINLLPLKEKQELLFQKNRNLVVVLGSMTIIFLICFSLILLSLKFYVLQKISHYRAILEDTEREYQTADFTSLLASVKKYNESLLKIESFYEGQINFTDALKKIIEIPRSGGISFSSIIMEEVADNKINVKLFGLSKNRDELIAFKKDVGSQKDIKNVYLPPENLVRPENIVFNLTFSYENTE